MNQPLFSLLFVLFPIVCYSQIATDSLRGPAEHSVRNNKTNIQKISSLPDSFLHAYTKVDSIRNTFNAESDSMLEQYHKRVAHIDSRANHLRRNIDSLERLNLFSNKYKRSLKKLSDLKKKTERQLTNKFNSLKTNTIGKLRAVELPPEYAQQLERVTREIVQMNVNKDVRIPELSIPGYEIPDLNDIDELPLMSKIGDEGEIPKLGPVGTPGGTGQISEQLKDYQDQIGDIASNDITNVQKLSQRLESQTSRIEGLEELQNQSGVIDNHRVKIDKLAKSANGKEKIIEVAKKAAVDHFAGKEKQLKATMVKISKYKQKYSSVSSLKNLPKRPLNPMKAKPFVERLTPGLYLQYQQRNFYLLDINPYLGYKLTGRLTGGLGWNHRYAYDGKHHSFGTLARVFGPRAYVDFKVGKGFIAHLEGETMNSFVPSLIIGNADTGHREWVWSFMTGIKKEYKIYKNLKGTALIQYNLFNRFYKTPYVDRFNSRIGFEYLLKKAKTRKIGN